MAKKSTMVIGTSAAALALLAGLGFAGVASAADSSGASSDSAKSTTQSEHGGHGSRGGHGNGEIASGLATKLGVDETEVSDALKSFKKANKPAERTEGTTKPDRSQRDEELAKSLAGSLGIEESKVVKALEELRSAARSERAEGLKSKLDAAVDSGTLTQAEADAVTKAVDKGVIGGR